MHISANSVGSGINPLRQLLGTAFPKGAGSTGQNSPGAADLPSAAPTSLAPSSPGRQFAPHTLSALLAHQQAQGADPATAAGDIAGRLIGAADTDHDGALGLDEVKPLGHRTQAVFTKLDADSDGKLDASELTAAVQQQLSRMEGRHRHRHGEPEQLSSADLAGKIVGAADSDSDGGLSQGEVSAALGKAGARMASDDLAKAFGKVDANGDGRLSGAELAAAIDALRAKFEMSAPTPAAASVEPNQSETAQSA